MWSLHTRDSLVDVDIIKNRPDIDTSYYIVIVFFTTMYI